MGRRSRLSFATVIVLQAIARGYRYGFDIMDATGLASGTVYPILGRLEDNALLRSRWEDPEVAHREKRPPRRYYEITAAGRRALERQLDDYRSIADMSASETCGEAGAETPAAEAES